MDEVGRMTLETLRVYRYDVTCVYKVKFTQDHI